jgi:hypothetical protein
MLWTAEAILPLVEHGYFIFILICFSYLVLMSTPVTSPLDNARAVKHLLSNAGLPLTAETCEEENILFTY